MVGIYFYFLFYYIRIKLKYSYIIFNLIILNKCIKLDENENYKLEICIYQTDELKVDTRIRHPSVIIYVVDISTWEYLRKNNANITNHENIYIEPILTKEFDFKFHK